MFRFIFHKPSRETFIVKRPSKRKVSILLSLLSILLQLLLQVIHNSQLKFQSHPSLSLSFPYLVAFLERAWNRGFSIFVKMDNPLGCVFSWHS